MSSASIKDEAARITRITWIGMICNLVLSAVKLTVGYLIGSLGLIADGFHSLSDLGTDFAVLIGATIAAKPADRSHPFGHGKFETFTIVFVAIALILVGVGLVWKAVNAVREPVVSVNGATIILVAILSIGVKEWLYRITLNVAEQCRSVALKANAWHHRSDALSSVVILAGGGAALLGWQQGDALAGLLVGLMVIAVGGKLGFEALIELSEGSAGKDTIEGIEEVINRFEEIRGTHRLRVRRIGRELTMDIHVVLDPDLTIKAGHDIVQRVEDTISKEIDWPITLTIHVDPDEGRGTE